MQNICSMPLLGRTREIVRPFAKRDFFSAVPERHLSFFRAQFHPLACTPQLETLAEYGLNYSMCRNARRAKIPAYQYVYIPQMKSLEVYARCFSKILDGKLYWYCLALDFITKTVVRDIFAVNWSSISRMSFYGR